MDRDARMVFLTIAILLMIGVVMIYSSSAAYAYENHKDGLYFVKRHLIHLVMGLCAAAACMLAPIGGIKDSARITMLVFILILAAVLIPGIGREINGARRWIRVFGFGFQPSEIAKLALIIYLADYSSRKRFLMGNLRHGFIPALAVTGLTGGLILLEPDMGTAVSILFIAMVMLFMAGTRIKHLASVVVMSLPILGAAVYAAPYRIRRFMVFFNPWQDPRGAGFQLIQSFIALGSGGLIGVGLGESRQKLFYLPESHTDFIFSIIGEELGFLGTASVLLLFTALIWFIMRIALRIKDLFPSRVVMGIGVMMAFEVIVNICVATGMLPTKGLPLPFISYGGSSLVCHLAAAGIILNMARRAE